MFIELYADGDITAGGLFFDPRDEAYVEVTDLDSAAGVEGGTLIQRGLCYIDSNRIREAVKSFGHNVDGEDLVLGWNRWNERGFRHYQEERFGVFEGGPVMEDSHKWGDLPRKDKERVAIVAEAVFRYYGFQDRASTTILVMEKGLGLTVADKKRLKSEWGASEVIMAEDTRKSVWKVLRVFGVRKPK